MVFLDPMLSNETKTLEQIIGDHGPAPHDSLTLDPFTEQLLASIMLTAQRPELRISDQHLCTRAQVRIERDIHRREIVFKLEGADRAGFGT